jgi:nucleotide-binding universal stress UspA family protein
MIGTLAVPDRDASAMATAEALAAKLGASILPSDAESADLIVVGSQPGGPLGRVSLSGATRTILNTVLGSVIVVPHGTSVEL